jgi:hypothetical protein
MTCRAWQNLLQQHLDGGDAGALERHLHACPDCAAEQPAIRRFLAALPLLATPEPPAGLAERIVARACGEARQRRLRLRRQLLPLAGLVAAALLLALGLRVWLPVTATPKGIDSKVAAVPGSPHEKPQDTAPLRHSVAEASTAVAALTSRTASQTVDNTRSLLPLLPTSTVEVLSSVPAPLEPPLEPLREASDGVSAGFAPVADSARRAVGLFFRDLPLGRTERPAPRSAKPG